MSFNKRLSKLVMTCIAAIITIFMLASVQSHDELNGRPHHIDVPANPTAIMRAFSEGKLGDNVTIQNLPALAQTTCSPGGLAGIYPCENIDLMSFMPLAQIGSTQTNDEANDIWGWTDPVTGNEYAIIGRVFGTSFIDITDPVNPQFIGELDTHTNFGSSWRDIKVYDNHAFIVSEARRHGMQVFDLTQLRNVTNPPVLFNETAHYRGFGSAHNIVINEQSGFAYGVGTDKCNGGLEMVNIQNPTNPTDAGCYDADGYTHDAQCVIYSGPDPDYAGQEICFASNEDTLTIVDVSNKTVPFEISRTGYAGFAYTHQGWLTEDQRYFLLDDELDEQNFGHNTRTFVWDVSDLDNPVLQGHFNGATSAIDHNQYVRGNCSFQANYRAGLRILDFDTSDPLATMQEVAYFDIFPQDDLNQFNAAWSNYPYFDSGNIIISGIEQGLYVVRPSDTILTNCGINNTPPSVAIDSPADGDTVSGLVGISITATDNEDAAGSLTVEWKIDDGAWSATDNNGTDIYTATWDTSTLTDAQYVLTVRATDSANSTSTAIHTLTTDNGNVASTIHLESMSGMTSSGKGGKWNAEITVVINDSAESATENATVNGSWSAGASGTSSCTTNASGSCTIVKSNISRRSQNATFTVNSVTHPLRSYAPGDNHGSSAITLTNPN